MNNSDLTSPILPILQTLFSDIHFIENFLPGEDYSCSGDGFDELKKLRIRGELHPVLILGFDSAEMMPTEHLDILAPGKQQAAFYLQLPCFWEQLDNMVQKVRRAPDALPLTRKEKIVQVRAFKHTCDNVRISRSGSTNRAKKMLIDSPNEALELLREFSPSRLGKFLEDYKDLSSVLDNLVLPNAEKIPGLFTEVQSMVEQIAKKEIDPEHAIDLSFSYIDKLKEISDILDGVKLNK